MKLKNKKTGEIVEVEGGYFTIVYEDDCEATYVTSLAKLNEEWEDYEEQTIFWYLDPFLKAKQGVIDDVEYAVKHNVHCFDSDPEMRDNSVEEMKKAGNYFDTKEETEKTAEKLKALTRLENNGFKFGGWEEGVHEDSNIIYCTIPSDSGIQASDLDLLFGGEE